MPKQYYCMRGRARHGHGGSNSLMGLFFEIVAKQAMSTAFDKNPANDPNVVFRIRTSLCSGLRCRRCVMACPNKVLTFKNGKIAINNIKDCSFCGICESICPNNAITVKK